MPILSISRALTWHADRQPEAISVRDHQGQLTRRELDLVSNRLARAYADLGVVRDDLVTVALPNSVEFYVACAAIWKLGAVPQPVSYRLPMPELEAIVELADSRVVIGAEIGGRPWLPAGFEADPALSDGLLPDEAGFSWKAPTSGGSTGRPKIILAGSPALVDPEVSGISYMPRDGVQLVPGPLYHNGPFIYSMRGLLSGMRLEVMPRFDAETVLRLVQERRVTWMLLVPTMMQRIWRLDPAVRDAYDLSSLEAFLHLGAPCPPWLKQVFIDWLGPDRVTELYAGTEAQAVTFLTGREWLEHPGSVGRTVLGQIRILDEHGREVPRGTVGEVFQMPAGGPGATYSYIGADPTSVDGWESLGDLGHVDDDGFLYLADRRKDLILSGGANIYPAEVEAVLDAHPAVRSSAVVGLPDDDLGERVHAIVDVAEATVTADELLAHVGERLVRYKVPRSVEIVREPLRDDAGKTRRSALREARITVA
ncbi:MAG TPA: AMP-binding protein [Mycobacteriales bacterium]